MKDIFDEDASAKIFGYKIGTQSFLDDLREIFPEIPKPGWSLPHNLWMQRSQ
jgi:hypothetical protein